MVRLSLFLLITETLINLKEKDKSVKLESLLYTKRKYLNKVFINKTKDYLNG